MFVSDFNQLKKITAFRVLIGNHSTEKKELLTKIKIIATDYQYIEIFIHYNTILEFT